MALHETGKDCEPEMKLGIYSARSTQVRFYKSTEIMRLQNMCKCASLASIFLFQGISIDIFSLVLLFTSNSLSLSLSLSASHALFFLSTVSLVLQSVLLDVFKFDPSYLRLDQSSNVSNLQLTWDLSFVVRPPKHLMDQPSSVCSVYSCSSFFRSWQEINLVT